MHMAKSLEHSAYKRIEWFLHHYYELGKEIRECRDDVLYGSANIDLRTPRGHSKHSDSTAAKGLLLAGSRQVQYYTNWKKAIDLTIDYFRNHPQGQTESQFFFAFYGEKKRLAAIARNMDVSTRTLERARDTIVSRCGLYAAKYGLITLDERNETPYDTEETAL